MVSPMSFEGMLILNISIECPHFSILPEIEGGQMPPQLRKNTSIEMYGRIGTRGYFCNLYSEISIFVALSSSLSRVIC